MNEVGGQTRQTLDGKWRAEFPILCVLSQITVGNMAFFWDIRWYREAVPEED